MEMATFYDKIDQTVKSGKEKMYFDLVGTANMRCWLNVYMPGSGTAVCTITIVTRLLR